MKWSWKAGQLNGIDLRIHSTFLLLLAWVWISYWIAARNVHALLMGTVFVAAVFGFVVLHEMGHAVAARAFGTPTGEITLLPIGGVARRERMPEGPKQELWVALAGPAANAAIAIVLYCSLAFTSGWSPFRQPATLQGPIVELLFLANLAIGLFNLIPGLPMDGGRVLRALLASHMNYTDATQLAASVGQALALVLGVAGLFTHPVLVFIGLVVWIGADQETGAAPVKSALSGTPALLAMLPHFEKLKSGDTLADAVRLTLRGWHHDFPVVEQGRVTGILTIADLLVALADHGQDYPVTAVMRREFLPAESRDMLEGVLQRVKDLDCHTVPVVDHGRLIGLITMANLGEYFLLQAATQKHVDQLVLLSRMLSRRKRSLARGAAEVPSQKLGETELVSIAPDV